MFPNVVFAGLFKRAILLSGSALASWAVVENPVSYALKLSKMLNCSIPEDLSRDHELLVDCLKASSLENLLQANIQAPTFLSAFGPSVDGVVIKPDFQKDLLSYMGPEFHGFGLVTPSWSSFFSSLFSNLFSGTFPITVLQKFSQKTGNNSKNPNSALQLQVTISMIYYLELRPTKLCGNLLKKTYRLDLKVNAEIGLLGRTSGMRTPTI